MVHLVGFRRDLGLRGTSQEGFGSSGAEPEKRYALSDSSLG